MKRSRFTDQQIAFALRQAEEGTPVAEVCRKMGISDVTFYTWKKKKYGGLMPSEVRKLKYLQEENQRLKKIVADLENRDHKRHGPHAESDMIGVPVTWNYVIAEDQVLEPLPEEVEKIFAAMGEEPWRLKSNSPDRWVGIPIAQVLGLNISSNGPVQHTRRP